MRNVTWPSGGEATCRQHEITPQHLDDLGLSERQHPPYPGPTPRRTVRVMGDIENDEIATEHWDDDGGHLATWRRRTVRDHSDQALQGGREADSDGATDAVVPPLMSTPRSREPHQIAHFPPL